MAITAWTNLTSGCRAAARTRLCPRCASTRRCAVIRPKTCLTAACGRTANQRLGTRRDDPQPVVEWYWAQPQTFDTLTLIFDNDFDNAMETVQMGHDCAVTPHCVTHYRLWADETLMADVTDNHHAVCEHRVDAPRTASVIRLEILNTAGALPALYALHVR